MNLMLLYIDPGTGSAIFTIFIGIVTAVVFTFQALFLKFKTFFLGGRAVQGAKNKFVIYAEDKRYWTLFKPIVEEFEILNIDLLYLTSSKDDPIFDVGFQHIKAEYLGEGNKAFARLNFLSAEFVLATTPGLDVYQWRRSKMVKHYSHILHSPVLLAGYELYGIDYYDSILLSENNYDKNFVRKLEKVRKLPEKQIVTVGCPYLDEYLKKMEQICKEVNPVFTVLVSPSWGKSALLSRFGEKLLDPLVKTNWRIIVRPNPQSVKVENELLESLSRKYEKYSNLEWDFERENINSLNKANVMISDFSGIILDYILLYKRPVFYISKNFDYRAYDAFEIFESQKEIFAMIEENCIAINPDSLEDLPNQISQTSCNATLHSAMVKMGSEVWSHQGNAGKRVVDFMINTVELKNA